MSRHYAHFTRRVLRLRFPEDPEDPWYSELQDVSGGLDRPRYHVTRAVSGRAADIKPGDTIWLVGQLYTPWGERFPAALDARIDVAAVTPRQGKPGFRYTAAETSQWLDLSDSTAALEALRCPNDNGPTRLWRDRDRPIGQYLRQIRAIANGDVLETWSADQRNRALHFVSYRIQDGTRPAYARAHALFEEGHRVFWDRWSLPRRLAERREAVGDEPLNATIEGKIHDAATVWGIETPLYDATGSYAAHERHLAECLNKYQGISACPLSRGGSVPLASDR